QEAKPGASQADAFGPVRGFMTVVEISLGRNEAHDVAGEAEPTPPTFEEFVESESARLFRALYLVTGSRHEAEEVMQDAFLAVWERWGRVGAMEDPTGYLFRTAMNAFRKRLRRASLAVRRTMALAPRED